MIRDDFEEIGKVFSF